MQDPRLSTLASDYQASALFLGGGTPKPQCFNSTDGARPVNPVKLCSYVCGPG